MWLSAKQACTGSLDFVDFTDIKAAGSEDHRFVCSFKNNAVLLVPLLLEDHSLVVVQKNAVLCVPLNSTR